MNRSWKLQATESALARAEDLQIEQSSLLRESARPLANATMARSNPVASMLCLPRLFFIRFIKEILNFSWISIESVNIEQLVGPHRLV